MSAAGASTPGKAFRLQAVRLRGWLAVRLSALLRAMRLIWASAPGWTATWLALLLAQGLLPALLISLARLLVNQIAGLLRDAPFAGGLSGVPWLEARPVLLLAGGMAALLLLDQLLQGLAGWVQAAQSAQVGLRVSTLIFEKSSQVDYSFYEVPEKYDQLHRAQDEAEYRPLAVMQSLGMLAQSCVTLLAMAGVLLPYGLWLPAVLLASSLPVLWVVLHYKRRQHAWQKRVSPQERRRWYYQWILTAQETAAELRLFGTGPFFIQAYRALREKLAGERLAMERDHMLSELAAGSIGLGAAGVCLAAMGWRALQGQATLGDLALFYGVFSQGQSILRSLLRGAGQLYGSLLFLNNLFEFLDLKNEIVEPVRPAPAPSRGRASALEIEGISFAYPGSDRRVFENFSLTLPAGKITAIVGDNGAGKSSLVKLLCRLYDPQSGRITWGGVDLRDLALADLRGEISALFQQPVEYQATAAENIGYSAISLANAMVSRSAEAENIGYNAISLANAVVSRSAEAENIGYSTVSLADAVISRSAEAESIGYSLVKFGNLTRINTAAAQASADSFLRRLPHGYATQLGKWFGDGTDLSVGQWQRVALARALFRPAPLLLLDEPTSAMDAWTEAEWLGRLRRICAGRTVLLITHRLTTAMRADAIHVMVDGKITESGSHADLLRLSGRYADAWQAQSLQERVLA